MSQPRITEPWLQLWNSETKSSSYSELSSSSTPFPDRLDHPELDHVVDQLDEVAGPGRPDVDDAVLGGQGVEDRLDEGERLLRAADHEAGAVAGAAHPAASAAVDEVDAPLRQLAEAADGVLPVGVAALDDHITGSHGFADGLDDLLGGITLRHGYEHDSWGGQLLHQRGDRVGGEDAGSWFRILLRVVGDDPDALLGRLKAKSLPHAAEPDHPELLHPGTRLRRVLSLELLGQVAQRGLVRLAERREGVDHVGQHRDGDAGSDGKDCFSDPLVSPGADGCRPYQNPPPGVSGQNEPAPPFTLTA